MPTVADILDEKTLLKAFELMDVLTAADDSANDDAIAALRAFISRKFMDMTA